MEEYLAALLEPLAITTWGGLGDGLDLPRLVLFVVSGSEGTTLDGREGFVAARIQCDAYGETYAEAKGLARSVQNTLVGHRGGPIWHVALDSIRDRPVTDESEILQRVSLDFAVTYRA